MPTTDPWPPGTRVTYDDESADNPEITGTVVTPTKHDLAFPYEYPIDPDRDVFVEWSDWVLGRSWHDVSTLQRLP